MVAKLRSLGKGEQGFTLIELLVVILIIGVLGAIAIPAFISQRDKADDAVGKEDVLSARTAIESYAVDNNGAYTNATVAILEGIEPTLAGATLAINAAGADTYDIQATSSTGNVFRVVRAADGTTTRPCVTAGDGGCPSDATW